MNISDIINRDNIQTNATPSSSQQDIGNTQVSTISTNSTARGISNTSDMSEFGEENPILVYANSRLVTTIAPGQNPVSNNMVPVTSTSSNVNTGTSTLQVTSTPSNANVGMTTVPSGTSESTDTSVPLTLADRFIDQILENFWMDEIIGSGNTVNSLLRSMISTYKQTWCEMKRATSANRDDALQTALEQTIALRDVLSNIETTTLDHEALKIATLYAYNEFIGTVSHLIDIIPK